MKRLKRNAGLGLGLLLSLVASDLRSENVLRKAWGLSGGFGVDAPSAQSLMKINCRKGGVVVAVIDTGIDPNHPALKDSLWVNTKELNGKPGVDDDGDGFVDDINGWDFVRNTGKLSDGHGHGTHIAGIISADGKDSESFRGVCPGVQIMPLRYYDPNGSGEDNLKNTVKAINFAVDHDVDLINYSGGGAEFSSSEFEALKRAERKGILVVAAAGNERSDADKNLYFPSAYNLSNILSVTAIDEKGSVLPSSNWGLKKVHVAAPGQSILSALPNGGYGFMSGTSQATAFVSGISAMLLSQERGSVTKQAVPARIRGMIEDSAQKYAQLAGKTKTGARVNAMAALKLEMQMNGKAPTRTLLASKVQRRARPVVENRAPARMPVRPSALLDRPGVRRASELVPGSAR